MNYQKIPIVNKIYSKLQKKFDYLEDEIKLLSQENISLRLRLKKQIGEKIVVVFVCHRPAVWGSLKTVYEALLNDPAFEVKIVTVPNKKQIPGKDLNHEIYESEGAENFWKGDNVIQGYDYQTKEWFDLQKLKPDYVFFQQPYDICRPQKYKSSYVSKYAKICFVLYFTFLANKTNDIINESCNPADFLKNLSLYFTQCEEDTVFIKRRMISKGNNSCKVIKTGFPCFDDIDKIEKDDSNWNFPQVEKMRFLWTPRWCTNEGNCHFFKYKDFLFKYMKEHDVDFIFRPHPQAFLNWKAEKLLTENEIQSIQNMFDSTPNMKIDKRGDYLRTFYSSSCLVTDISGIIPEYFLTGKPIIYCYSKDSYNDFIKGKGYTAGFYWVENETELKNALDMIMRGEDPLKEKREELIKTEFFLPNEGAGNLIKEEIKKDFLNA